jgi:chitin-binding protein
LGPAAPTQPISRTAACASGGEDTGAAACVAAKKANGQAFGSFDNLRVPNVNGADKSMIPDGKLCSGGLAAFKGLDLPRTDWPSTTLTAGGTFTVVYKATIPHDGRFRIYLSRTGYDPKKPLGWDDLTSSPILTVNQPALSGGAYRMSGKLPADRSGRHLLYIVWQTTSTPDTYYSCSDLIIKPAAAARKAVVAPARPTPAARRSSAAVTRSPAAAPATSAAAPGTVAAPALSPVSSQTNWKADLGREIVAGALLVIVAVAAGMALVRIRRRRGATR